MSEPDLVIVTLAGVQRFITESRTTTDLATASNLVTRLAQAAAEQLVKHGDHPTEHGPELIFPSRSAVQNDDSGLGLPNRIVALIPAGGGPAAARAAKDRVQREWRTMVEKVFTTVGDLQPGWPIVQWVSVPAGDGGYQQQWTDAQRLLADRKNIRDFTQINDDLQVDEDKTDLCTLAPRWRAVEVPHGVAPHLRTEKLSQPVWVKRWLRNAESKERPPRPSTNSIASAPFRAAVLKHREDAEVAARVLKLHKAVVDVRDLFLEVARERDDDDGFSGIPSAAPASLTQQYPNSDLSAVWKWYRDAGGLWSYPATWNNAALLHRARRELGLRSINEISADNRELIAVASALGADAARDLSAYMSSTAPAQRDGDDITSYDLSPHLAILVQDIDSLGTFLSGHSKSQGGRTLDPEPRNHQSVSQRLSEVATQQSTVIRERGGDVIYAGGDDLLALVPASQAVTIAAKCRAAVGGDLPTASTGLLFFHHDYPLRQALVRAHELLAEAKERPDKNSLGIGYIRRSGAKAACVVRWERDFQAVEKALRVFVRPNEQSSRLSPRLLADITTELPQLVQGGPSSLPRDFATRELRRLVHRHTTIPNASKRRDDLQPDGTGPYAIYVDAALAAFQRLAPKDQFISEEAVKVALFLRQESHSDHG